MDFDQLTGGHSQILIRIISQANIDSLIEVFSLDKRKYYELGVGIEEFRSTMNNNFAQFSTDLGVPSLELLKGGDSWFTVRDIINYNFSLLKNAVPSGAVMHLDFDNNVFFWDGSSKQLSDLSVAPVGGYYLDVALDMTGDNVVVYEVSIDQDESPGGHTISWTSGYPGGDRMEFQLSASALQIGHRLYTNRSSVGAGYYPFETRSVNSYADPAKVGSARRRVTLRWNAGDPFKYMVCNGEIKESGFNCNALSASTRWGFGNRVWSSGDPDQPMVDATLHRVTVWNETMTDEELEAIAAQSAWSPIHMIGDSFLSQQSILTDVLMLNTSGKYISSSQDNVGGSSLVDQAASFIVNDSKWHDSTLIIVDGGLSDSAVDAISSIDSMVSTLNHNRWLYIEPAPSEADGIGERDTWNATVAAIKSHCGGNYVETLVGAQALSDGSPEDLAEVAKGLWPLSLKNSAVDFHPNSEGNLYLANVITAALKSKGWL